MRVDCPGCGATLQLNPNLAGTDVPCPQCGGPIRVPKPEPPPPRRRAPPPPAAARQKRKKTPLTFWLIGAQASLAVLGISCLIAAFAADWIPPPSSYFAEHELWLALAGVGLLLAGWITTYVPVLATLGVSILVLCAAAQHFVVADEVDASRTLALMVAMLALWLALQHRRTLQ